MANSSAARPSIWWPAVGDEVEDEAQLAQLLGELAHLLVAHAGGVPVERRRQVVGQHLVGELGVDGVGEALGVGQVGGLGLHPQDVGEGRGGQRLGDGVVDAALDLVVALGRLADLAVPDDVDAHGAGPRAGGVEGGGAGEGQPLLGRQLEALALAAAELDDVGHRLGVALEVGLRLPGLQVAGVDLVEQAPRGPGPRPS